MAGNSFFPCEASMDTITAQYASQIPDLIAGTALPLAAACYIDATGLAQLCDATGADIKGGFKGMPGRAVAAGEPVTLFGPGTRFLYDTAAPLTAGMQLFLDVVPGGLNDTAQVGDSTGVAIAINTTEIVITNFKTIGG